MPEAPAPDKPSAQDQPSDDLSGLSPSQLRAEITRLEGVLQAWQPGTMPTLRTHLDDALTKARRELTSRRSTGKTLDQAESRYKQTQTATHLAEQQLLQAQKTVTVASDALRQARENEQAALNELTRLKALIAEVTVEVPPPQANIPPQVLAGVFAVLQHAGLQPE